MGETPLVSVIVPVYNIKEYLPRCVRSILHQTYQNLEVILVDDGSTDGTGQLCDRLAQEDSRIRVFHKENGGSSSARNLGISYAKGSYLGFVDSDDYIEPWMYERLVAARLASGAQIVQVGRDEVDAEGRTLPNICEPPAEDTFIPSEGFMRELLMHRGDCSFCTKLVDKVLFADYQFPLGVLNEDFHILVQMLLKTKGVMSLSGQAYHVFYRIGSNTRKQDKKEFSRVYGDNVDNADMVYGLVQQQMPELLDVAVRFGLYQRLDYLLHIPVEQMTRDNSMYQQICKYIRTHIADVLKSDYLTPKNKIYLGLFAIAPKAVRELHALWMKVRERKNTI